MIRVRHAAAAIALGLCETVLITHGESGRSGVGRTRNVVAPTSLAGQFEQPYDPRAAGPSGPSLGRRLCSRSRCSATSRPMGSRTAIGDGLGRAARMGAKNPRTTFKTPALPAPRAGAWR
jgi:hypothetical protein